MNLFYAVISMSMLIVLNSCVPMTQSDRDELTKRPYEADKNIPLDASEESLSSILPEKGGILG